MIEVSNLSKTYNGITYVLSNLNLKVRKGEYITITGESGSGKSTLLNIIGLLDSAFSGTLVINGQDISGLGDEETSRFRNENLGFIFQAYNLINDMTAIENICLPALYSRRMLTKDFLQSIESSMEKLNILTLKHMKVRYLSGGEKQRVAIARALSLNPNIILADEPTGNLDKRNSDIVFSTLRELNQVGKTVILVTHTQKTITESNRVLTLKNGVLT